MRESQMEELIAKYPEDFFPKQTFKLTGRQVSFPGVGRFDLMFQDEYQTNILMELKARPAKYEDATQLAKYRDALVKQGSRNVLMWLVATDIPHSVREFLDKIGIEYSEIHEAWYRHVARRHGDTVDTVTDIERTAIGRPHGQTPKPIAKKTDFTHGGPSSEECQVEKRTEGIEDQKDLDFPSGLPQALTQVLEVIDAVVRLGFSRRDATKHVAVGRKVTLQTIQDKYARQLGKSAGKFDELLRPENIGNLQSLLVNKFPQHKGYISEFFGRLR